jgi:hypothetical protein
MRGLPWWLWAAAGLFGLVYLALISARAYRRSVVDELVEHLREHHPEITIVNRGRGIWMTDRQISVRTRTGEAIARLDSLFAQLAGVRVSDKDRRREAIATWARAVDQASAVPDPSKQRENLLPRLMPREQVAADMIAGPLDGTDLHIAYVVDMPDCVQFVTSQTLQSLAVSDDELHALALANLRKRWSPEPVRAALDKRALTVVATGDGFDAARLLLVPESLQPGEQIAAVVPDKNALALSPVPENGDWTKLISLARTIEATPPRLSSLPIRVSNTGFHFVRSPRDSDA